MFRSPGLGASSFSFLPMRRTRNTPALFLSGVLALTFTFPAHAQSVLGVDQATAGTTEVAVEGVEIVADLPVDETRATDVKISAGGLMSTGNAESLAATGNATMRIRREANQYSAALAMNYARASVDGADAETTVENYQARVRYDRFLSKHWALFMAESGRRDRFQGLDLRFNFAPGAAYYFISEASHRFWGEFGYDLQYDIRESSAVANAAEAGTPVATTETRHNARLFAGYENNLNEHVKFTTGLEYLQAFASTENWRLNWDLGLNAVIAGDFSLATTFFLRYDNNPLPEIRKLDTVTAVSVVYTLL